MSINNVIFNKTEQNVCTQGIESSGPPSIKNKLSTADLLYQCESKGFLSVFFSKIFQWLENVFRWFFPSAKTHIIPKTLTQEQFENRIQKGRTWIEKSITEHLGNNTRKAKLSRDKFLVIMKYNEVTSIAFPTSKTVDLKQLTKDAIAKFETMMRHSVNQEQIEANLEISTYFFTRLVNTEGKVSPYIWKGERRDSRNFRIDRDNYVTHGEKIEDLDLNSWLTKFIPSSINENERKQISTYVSQVINW